MSFIGITKNIFYLNFLIFIILTILIIIILWIRSIDKIFSDGRPLVVMFGIYLIYFAITLGGSLAFNISNIRAYRNNPILYQYVFSILLSIFLYCVGLGFTL